MKKKEIIFDLRTATMLGPASTVFWSLKYYQDLGYKIILINKHWSTENKKDGLKYDEKEKKFKSGSSQYLWDPAIHPNDILYNLIIPTFTNLEIIEKNYSYISRVLLNIPPFFSSKKIHMNDFATYFLEKKDKESYFKLKENYYKNNKSVVEFIRYNLNWLYFKFFIDKKKIPISKPFRYKLSDKLNNQSVRKFINDAKTDGAKNILISILWDENQKFEKQNDRLKGGPHFIESEWKKLLSFVRKLDNYAIETKKIKFVLASKKAVDWEVFLKSKFVDLRNFEELGFSLSQSIYIAQEICDVSINWPSTYTIWISNCENMLHLTWGGNKDTAKWARNDNNNLAVESLLKTIGAD